VSIREIIRAGKDLLPYFQQTVLLKPEGHALSMDHLPGTRCMRQIGG
jgi:hypothetical protein